MVFKKKDFQDNAQIIENNRLEDNDLPKFNEEDTKSEQVLKIELPSEYDFITSAEFLGISNKGKEVFRYILESTQKLRIGLIED